MTTPPPEGADPTAGPQPDSSPKREPAAHDPTGLDLAKSVASQLRGTTAPRPRATSPGRSRRRDPSQLSGAHPDDRDPTLLGSAVDRLVQDSGWSTDVSVHAVLGRWPQIVGPEVALHCEPTTYSDGVLAVRADSTAWATQLTLLAANVVARLNAELGDGTVLRIDVSGPAGPTWRRGRRSVRDGRGPRDTYG